MKVDRIRGGRPVDILLVEDNPAHVDLTREALREGKVANTLNVATDGEEAMDYLLRRGSYKGVRRPDIILLDLNLPKKDGREVLAEIKADESLRQIPVVIMTTSSDEEDVIKSYKLHVNCYITKPVNIDQFIEVIRSIDHFWFNVVTLPETPE